MEALISYRKPPVVTEAASFKEKVRERERGEARRGEEENLREGQGKGCPRIKRDGRKQRTFHPDRFAREKKKLRGASMREEEEEP